MPTLKSFHNRPIRIGRLLWRPGQTHEVMPHWMNKSVMRAVVKKGWLREISQSEKIKEDVYEILGEESKQEDIVPPSNEPPFVEATGDLLSDVGADGEPAPEAEETLPEPQALLNEEQDTCDSVEKYDRDYLDSLDFKDLRDIGSKLNVTGRAKSDLIDRILEAQSGE